MIFRSLTSLCIIGVLGLMGCRSHPGENDADQLNGYWEIQMVTLPDGNIREFKVNPIIDHWVVENGHGVRTKVRAQTDGRFETATDGEDFKVATIHDTLWILYKNAFGEWRERLVNVSENAFSVVDTAGTIYDYRKFISEKSTP